MSSSIFHLSLLLFGQEPLEALNLRAIFLEKTFKSKSTDNHLWIQEIYPHDYDDIAYYQEEHHHLFIICHYSSSFIIIIISHCYHQSSLSFVIIHQSLRIYDTLLTTNSTTDYPHHPLRIFIKICYCRQQGTSQLWSKESKNICEKRKAVTCPRVG